MAVQKIRLSEDQFKVLASLSSKSPKDVKQLMEVTGKSGHKTTETVESMLRTTPELVGRNNTSAGFSYYAKPAGKEAAKQLREEHESR